MDREVLATSWLRWVTTALIAVALAVVVRTVAALLDVEVVVPRPGQDGLVPLELGSIIAVTVGVTLAAIVTVVLAGALLPGRVRGLTQLLAALVLLGSMVPLVLAELPRDGLVTLMAMHLVVGVTVLVGVVRDA